MVGHRFDGKIGKIVDKDMACERSGSSAVSETKEKDNILKNVEQVLGQFSLVLTRGQITDLELEKVMIGHNKKTEYYAHLLFKEEEKTAVFWEMIRESGSNVGFLAGFKIDKIKNANLSLSENSNVEFSSEHIKIREVIKEIIRKHGWKFQTALFKRKAMYQESEVAK